MKIYIVVYSDFNKETTQVNTFTDPSLAIKKAKETIHAIDGSLSAVLFDDSDIEDFEFVDGKHGIYIHTSEVEVKNPYSDLSYLKAQLVVGEAIKPVFKPKFEWLKNWTDYGVDKIPLGFTLNGVPLLHDEYSPYNAIFSYDLTEPQKKAISIARLKFLKSDNDTLVVENLDNGAVCCYGKDDLEYHIRNETEIGKFVQENILKDIDILLDHYRDSSEEEYDYDESSSED